MEKKEEMLQFDTDEQKPDKDLKSQNKKFNPYK